MHTRVRESMTSTQDADWKLFHVQRGELRATIVVDVAVADRVPDPRRPLLLEVRIPLLDPRASWHHGKGE